MCAMISKVDLWLPLVRAHTHTHAHTHAHAHIKDSVPCPAITFIGTAAARDPTLNSCQFSSNTLRSKCAIYICAETKVWVTLFPPRWHLASTGESEQEQLQHSGSPVSRVLAPDTVVTWSFVVVLCSNRCNRSSDLLSVNTCLFVP